VTFDDLWTDYLEGDLDEPGLAELERLLASDPDLTGRAAALFAEHRALGLLHAPPDADDFARATLERLKRDRDAFVSSVTGGLPPAPAAPPRRRWKDLALVAAATLVFSLILQVVLVPRRGTPVPPPPATAVLPVATLVETRKARWEPAGTRRPGERLVPGTVRLTGGEAVLQLDGGAIALLHGPADVQVESRGALRVRHGRILVRTEDPSSGVAVRTPLGEALAQDAELVVSVEISGATELHVQAGEVGWTRDPGHPPTLTLKRGQAVRFEVAHGSEGRMIAFAAQSLEDVLRERSIEMIPSRPDSEEDFEYGAGDLPVAAAGGGFGWKGPWRLRRGAEVTGERDSSDAMRILPGSLGGPWLPAPERGGALALPPGATFLLRELKEPIDLRGDGVHYVSFLLRREADAPPGSSEWPHFRLTLRSSADYWGSCVAVSLPLSRRPTIQLQSRDFFTAPLEVDVGATTLWVLKVVGSRSGPGELFLKVFRGAEALPRFEPSQWSVATGPLMSEGRLDVVVVTGTGPATHVIDGIRVGRSWESVVRRD
jgi:hypothetical protein